MLLTKKNAEYKKVIGNKPDDEQRWLILWNVLDAESKWIAASDNVSAMPYKKFCLWIDMRYKCAHGNLEYTSQGKDDPMGLALFAESDSCPQYPPSLATAADAPIEPAAEIDAFGKGKGKGKSDGRCHVCNAEGHFARVCPSTPPVSPSLSNVWDAMGGDTINENFRQRIPISKAEKEKTEERDGVLAKGTEVRVAKAKEEKEKDTEITAKERAKHTEVKDCTVSI